MKLDQEQKLKSHDLILYGLLRASIGENLENSR